MDAKLLRITAVVVCGLIPSPVQAATHATANFVVTAPTAEVARKVAEAAEYWRHELALQWLGRGLPNWSRPCPVSVRVGQIGAGGSTTFTFENGEVFGWNMKVQGTLERILDSVIPHEVNHTIFASHFRRPLPRWADEGAATLIEHESERARQQALLHQVLGTNRRIPLARLLQMKEYPSDMHQVLTLYAEGYSLADFLIQQDPRTGRARYLTFLDDAERVGWTRAVQKHYGFSDISQLEGEWTDWVMAGSPRLNLPDGVQLADAESGPEASQSAAMVIRSQSPPEPPQSESSELPPLPMIPRRIRDSQESSPISAPLPTVTTSRIGTDPASDSRSRREEGNRDQSSLSDAPATPADGQLRRRVQEVSIRAVEAAHRSSIR